MKVSELMTREVRTCQPQDSLDQAARLMWDGDCGILPVVGPGGRVQGMVTDRDACMAAYTKGRRLGEIRVSDVMATQVFTCSSGDDVEKALSIMEAKRVRRLPVLDDSGKLAGILSLNDVARAAEGQRKAGQQAMTSHLAQALSGVCQPRSGAEPVKTVQPTAPPPTRAGTRAGAKP